MANVIEGKGTTLKLGSNVIGEIYTLTGIGVEVDMVETTSNSTTTGRTYRPGMHKVNPVSGELWFDPDDTQHAAVYALLASKGLSTWVITVATATPTTYTFSGYLSKFEISGHTPEDNVSVSFEIQPTGNVVKAGGGAPPEEEE